MYSDLKNQFKSQYTNDFIFELEPSEANNFQRQGNILDNSRSS